MEKIFDIEIELNQIVFHYNIDKHYPNYRDYVQACYLLHNFYKEQVKAEKKIILISHSKTDIDWMQSCICFKEEKSVQYSLDDSNLNVFDKEGIYFNLSYSHRDEITLDLRLKSIDIISIYDLFEMNQLYFKNEFYDIYGEEYLTFRGDEIKRDLSAFDINHIFFRHRNLYETSVNSKEKKFYLEKIIFDCVYAKDFLSLKKYIDMVETSDKKIYQQFYREIEILLNKIKVGLVKRKKDVFIVWLDALEYGEDEEMVYLKAFEKEAVTFTNAYTVTPYTGSTFKTLFAGKRAVEENAFRIDKVTKKDSCLFEELDKINYQFKYYGPLKLVNKSNQGNSFFSYYSDITRLYWSVLRDLLICENNKNNVCVLHEVLQTHLPYISMGITGTEYWGREEWPGQQENIIIRKKQAKESRRYVDKQLEFWTELLPKQMTKIFLSDHGHTQFGRFHTILKIQNQKLTPCKVSKLFSYVNFEKLLLDIICKGEINENCLMDEYVWVQDVDYYYKPYIYQCVKDRKFNPEGMFGYQGIITSEDMLLKYNHGTIFYLKHRNDEVMVLDDRIQHLQSLLSKKKVDVESEAKFEATRLIYSAWEKSSERYKEEEENKKRIIVDIFRGFENDSIVAVRGGGMHTLRLLMLLPYELRSKVKYIIDYDDKCISSRLGIKVINPYNIEDYNINRILLSSFDYKEIWKKELEMFNGAVIDLYDEFEKEGIICNHEFYNRQYTSQDFII